MPTDFLGTVHASASVFGLNAPWSSPREPKSIEQLSTLARELAETLEISVRPARSRSLRSQVRHLKGYLLGVYEELVQDVRNGLPVSNGGEWILDNFFIIEDQLREIVDDLPKRFERQLPKLANGILRVHALGRELIAHTDGALDEETLNRFVAEFQSISPFSIGELWAFPIMLRFALIENLCAVCVQVMHTRRCELWAKEIHEHWQTHHQLKVDHWPIEHTRTLIPELIEKLHEPGVTHAAGLAELGRRIEKHGLSIGDAVHLEHQRRASNQITIANIITGMRLISSLDWVSFFERHSFVERKLCEDPGEIYPQLDLETRDRYRHVVEKMARRSRRSDIEVAHAAVALATSMDPNDPVASHVGYWFQTPGRANLEQSVGYVPGFRDRLRRCVFAHPNLTYFGAIAGLMLLGMGLLTTMSLRGGVSGIATLALSIFAIIPVSELAVSITNLLVTTLIRPNILPKLDLSKGIPDHFKTVVVIPCLLTSKREIDSLLSNIEIHYVSNSEPALRFALLTDFTDHTESIRPDDDELLERMRLGIDQLNERYASADGEPFYLFHRSRRWNPADAIWMGWERKRGKLMEFNRWLLGQIENPFALTVGETDWFWNEERQSELRFVITLDADTYLPSGSAAKLIGAMGHPLNRPRWNAESGRIERGYSVMQPRVNIRLSDSNRTWYSRIFANSPGVDPYVTSASDVYQDLFGEGSYTGKGIYDLRSFEKGVSGVFPDNQILSHDLIEGCHVRAALVSDIELTDGFPARYDGDAKRQHRWARGDWQLLPWLGPIVPFKTGHRHNPLSLLSRWKIFDNLRRSLVPMTLLVVLLCSWIWAPSQAIGWSLLAFFVIAFPLVGQITSALRSLRRTPGWWIRLQMIGGELLRGLLQTIFAVSMLPQRAILMFDAIARTLWRHWFTRTRMLEWETAAATERRLSRNRSLLSLQLLWPVLIAVATTFVIPSISWLGAAPWLIAWAGSPLLGFWFNRPLRSSAMYMSQADRKYLRRVARNTWAFFETYVGATDNWLPPDNVQEIPTQKIAHRISPTNQGLFLVSGLVAHDFGFIGIHQLIELWEKNLFSWEQLDRFNGHYYNWYDTTSLRPLFPRYVSTVDSGNLDASCLVMRQGIEDLRGMQLFGERSWCGICDSLDMADEALDQVPQNNGKFDKQQFGALRQAIVQLKERFSVQPENIFAWGDRLEDATRICGRLPANHLQLPAQEAMEFDVARTKVQHLVRHLHELQNDFKTLFPWCEVIAQDFNRTTQNSASELSRWIQSQPEIEPNWRGLCEHLQGATSISQIAQCDTSTTSDLAKIESAHGQLGETALRDASGTLERLRSAISVAAESARRLTGRMSHLAERFENLSTEMDYTFLFNPQRRLFSIGFNLEEKQLDRAHYDMLCSEARLASFLAIGKGNVETRHWFQLGRRLTSSRGKALLLSWGGTMFEYLMPNLFQRLYERSLLEESCRGAVAIQREFGRRQNFPWGVSESAYAALGTNADYQYRSFGVPGLGLKRGLGKDMVVSPYSTMLALEIEPRTSIDNLHTLAKEQAEGPWGFYESVDYTPIRTPAGARSIVVRCAMSHHQSMSLVAIGNAQSGGKTRKRFHAHPLVRACELLLQERVPHNAQPVVPHPDDLVLSQVPGADKEFVSRRFSGVTTTTPRTQLLSNGRLTTMVTSNGSGFCRFGDTAITRWRPDSTRDHWGMFFYLRDVRSGRLWSPTYQPTCVEPDSYEVVFSIDKAEFSRRDGQWETKMEVAVSPENNAEVRTLKVTNGSLHAREIRITSCAELALSNVAADLAHPAFEKLFLQTESLMPTPALLASRRPRDSAQVTPWAIHVMAIDKQLPHKLHFESSRQKFVGRGRTLHSPAACDAAARLSGTVGPVLDPVLSLGCTLVLPPNATVSLGFATAYAESRDEAVMLAQHYCDPRSIQRAFDLAWAYNQIQLRHMHVSATQAHLYQRIASALIYPDPNFRGRAELLASNQQGQVGLWRYGISGDRPILLLHLTQPEQLYLVRDLWSAQQYWRAHGLSTDLVFLNDHPGSYFDFLHEQLTAWLTEVPRVPEDKSTGVYILRGAQISDEDKALLEAAAAIVLHGGKGTLSRQFRAQRDSHKDVSAPSSIGELSESGKRPESSPAASASGKSSRSVVEPERGLDGDDSARRLQLIGELEFWNGMGGFAENGREYRILLSGGTSTPLPWSNVIANPNFGCLVTESGGGFTWFENSRENRLSTWSNDPVSDTPAEAIFVRDDDTGETWSPLANVMRDAGDYWIHHGQGYSRFIHSASGCDHEVHISVAQSDPVKFVRVRLRNRLAKKRRLSVTYFVEWVLGDFREKTSCHVITGREPSSGALLASNRYHAEYPEQVAFLQVLEHVRTWTGDRTEFLGRNGSPFNPISLYKEKLSGRVGPGMDPCGALQAYVDLNPGAEVDVTFLLGAAKSRTEAVELLAKYSSTRSVNQEIHNCQAAWEHTLSAFQVETPHRALNFLVNRWLLYQIISCRLWGRSAFYQSGGAFGFRDQLQDVLALLNCKPDLARQHLLLAASRQFEEGDVQHWWHPPTGRGTRTRSSDDFLWLPFAVSKYVEATGDQALLDEEISFLSSNPLSDHEQERYETPEISTQSGSLYDHCRAIQHGLKFGQHDLPLIGSGDWNDGMNKLGEKGKGESVWVGWFMSVILDRFSKLARSRGDLAVSQEYERVERRLKDALEKHAWDGEWYRRAYSDEGIPIGSKNNAECQIDSIAQSWSAFAGANPERVAQAIDHAFNRLVVPDKKLVLLLTPPFDKSEVDPGYIQGYLPGIRENGGQYTHAAIWLMQALAQIQDFDRALAIFELIHPVAHGSSPNEIHRYQVEPYVVAADVYGVPPHQGRGGWTWYTGSAAWMYQAILESLLGIRIERNRVIVSGNLPKTWSEFSFSIRRHNTHWRFNILRDSKMAKGAATISPGQPVPLVEDGGSHEITIVRDQEVDEQHNREAVSSRPN